MTPDYFHNLMVLVDVIILMDRVERKPDVAANIKDADQPTHPRSLISAFIFRSQVSIIDKLATRKISAF